MFDIKNILIRPGSSCGHRIVDEENIFTFNGNDRVFDGKIPTAQTFIAEVVFI